MRRKQILFSSVRPIHICAVFAALYLLAILSAHQWNPMAFVRIGGHFDPRVGGEEMGYDGQFAYQIAREPLEGWRYCDVPAYRYQRIFYPLVVRMLTFGQEGVIPWMMVTVNLIAYLAAVWLLEKLLAAYRQSAWYALAYGLFIGVLMSIRLDLNEPLAYALVLAGIWDWIRENKGRGVLFFALAILTKEITVIFLSAFTLAEFFHNKKGAVIHLLTGIAPFVVWRLALIYFFQDPEFHSGGAMASSFEWIPYFGWWKTALYAPQYFFTISLLIVPLVILPSFTGLWISIRDLIHGKVDESTLTLLATCGVIPLLPTSNLIDPLGISRTLIAVVIAFLFYGAKQDNKHVLRDCLLFCITAVFIWQDSFLPVGAFK